jgi:hypothetical protein
MDANDDRCIDSAEEVGISVNNPLGPFNNILLQWIARTLKPVHVGGPYPSVSDIPTAVIVAPYISFNSSLEDMRFLSALKRLMEPTGIV